MVFYIRKRFLVFAAAIVVLGAAQGRSEVIDRIVAVVEGRIITLSDLRGEREVRIQLKESAPESNSALARELADEYLVEREVVDYPNTEVTNAEIDADLAKFGVRQPASARLQETIRRRIRAQKYMDLRFRPLIRAADDEVRAYYEKVFIPAASVKEPSAIRPLTDPQMASLIRNNVIDEKLTREVVSWLDGIRKRSTVEFFD